MDHLAFLLLLVLIGVYAGSSLYRSTAAGKELEEAIAEADALDPGWRLEELEAKRNSIPDGENSALQIMAVRRLLPGPWLGSPFPDLYEFTFGAEFRLADEQVKYLQSELGKVAEARLTARKIADLHHGRFPLDYGFDSNDIRWNDASRAPRHAGDEHSVANLLYYDALLLAEVNDIDHALASTRGMLNVARSLVDEPFLISQLVRVGICRRTISVLERVLAQGQPSEASLMACQRLMEDEQAHPWLLIALRGERAGGHAQSSAIRAGKIKTENVALLALAEKDSEARMLKLRTQCVEIAKLPKSQQDRKFDQLASSIESGVKRATHSVADVAAGMEMPAIGRHRQSYWEMQAQLRCATTALAAERYRIVHGGWPDSVAILAKEVPVRMVVIDPYDEKPLRMRRLKDGVVIYSIGPDCKDDGGALNRQDVGALGVDIGFRLWDVAQRGQPVPELIPPPSEDHGP